MSRSPSHFIQLPGFDENELVPSPSGLPAGDKNTNQNETKIVVMDDIPSKDKLKGEENIMDVLTEKQPEAIQGRCRFHWVYTEQEVFEYEPDRNWFIALTFLIVFVMLCISTAGIVAAVVIPEVKEFMTKSIPGLILLLTGGICVLLIQVVFCFDCVRHVPWVLLALFLALYGCTMVLIYIGCKYAPDIIIAAAAGTAVVAFVCFLLALTPIDFTKYYIVVVVASIAVFIALLVCTFLKFVFGLDVTIARLVILCISVIVQAVMFVIELQMILGGKAMELTTDEYFFAALLVYLSIIELFLTLVEIIAKVYELMED